MATITEIARVNGTAYGVKFVVCSNAEVAGLALELDDHDDALPIMQDVARAISHAGYDYDRCSDFRAYNGGPRVGLVDAIFYVADLEFEGDVKPADADCDLGDWRVTWQRGAGAVAIPKEIEAMADAVVDAAWATVKKDVEELKAAYEKNDE